MLMEDFKKWRYNNGSCLEDTIDNFNIFYQQCCLGKSFVEMLADLAYQIHDLQVCVEGLIEDQER